MSTKKRAKRKRHRKLGKVAKQATRPSKEKGVNPCVERRARKVRLPLGMLPVRAHLRRRAKKGKRSAAGRPEVQRAIM